jgi:hypothetical protein
MSIPSLSSLVGLWRDTLVADSALSTYCTGTLGGALKVYVGLDEKNPPMISNCPFLVIVPQGTRPGYQEDMHSWSVVIYLGINDGMFSDYQSKGATEMRGFHRIDSMWNLVQTALDGLATTTNVTADMIQYQVNMEAFPLIQASAMIQARLPNTIGINIAL